RAPPCHYQNPYYSALEAFLTLPAYVWNILSTLYHKTREIYIGKIKKEKKQPPGDDGKLLF
ncbi:MAG: hypothetical protein IIX05_10525, partial [Selenomonadaceae bacterium]|nr:hypothetical protein [Selenomonadaceae bacterium]